MVGQLIGHIVSFYIICFELFQQKLTVMHNIEQRTRNNAFLVYHENNSRRVRFNLDLSYIIINVRSLAFLQVQLKKRSHMSS